MPYITTSCVLSCPVLCFSQLVDRPHARVMLFLTIILINIMHIHKSFHFFSNFKKLPCFTLHVDCLPLIKIYGMHKLFFPSSELATL